MGRLQGSLLVLISQKVFFGKNVPTAFKHYIYNELHFVEGTLTFDDLGVPIFYSKLRACHLRNMTEKILGKFDRWSGSLLSLGGRGCLVNSVIASSLTHCMMVYRWSRVLLKQIDVAMRNFIWNGDVNKQSRGGMWLGLGFVLLTKKGTWSSIDTSIKRGVFILVSLGNYERERPWAQFYPSKTHHFRRERCEIFYILFNMAWFESD